MTILDRFHCIIYYVSKNIRVPHCLLWGNNSSGERRHGKKDRQPSPEPLTYTPTWSFSHANHGIGYAPSSHIAPYVPVTGVSNPRRIKTRDLKAGTCMLDIRKRVLLMHPQLPYVANVYLQSMQQRNNGAQCARSFHAHFNSSTTPSPNNSQIKYSWMAPGLRKPQEFSLQIIWANMVSGRSLIWAAYIHVCIHTVSHACLRNAPVCWMLVGSTTIQHTSASLEVAGLKRSYIRHTCDWHISSNVGRRSMADSVACVAETPRKNVGHRFGARLSVLFPCRLSPELCCFLRV